MSPRDTSGTGPFDENTLRTLFAEIEAPPTLEARWQARVALAVEPATGTGREDLPETPRVRVLDEEPARSPRRPWLRSLGAALAAAAVGGGIIGAVAVSRQPSPDPRPDPTVIETITEGPTTNSVPPTQTSQSGIPSAGPPVSQPSGAPPTGGAPVAGGPTGPGGTAGPAVPPAPAPARGPLAEWPNAANTGVPAGTQSRQHTGDLHVTQPGALIADLKVTGSVYVEAPDVTLRRVQVQPPSGTDTGIRQLPQAPRLRIEDSEVSPAGGITTGIRQEAPGLVVQRSDVRGPGVSAILGSDATLVDSYLAIVRSPGNSARITMRHNAMTQIGIRGDSGPITDVTIDNNAFDATDQVVIFAPATAGSRDIRVTGNQFRRSTKGIPSSGWNPQAPGNIWTGNVWFGTNEPVNP